MRVKVFLAVHVLVIALASRAAAVDLTGTFRVVSSPDILMDGAELWQFTQTGNVLDLVSPIYNNTGSIDAGTGDFDFDLGPGPISFCPNSSLTGSADDAGLSFLAVGSEAATPMCHTFNIIHVGVRCVNDALDVADCITAFATRSGAKLIVRDKASNADARRITVLSRDPAIAVPSSTAPDSPLRGARLIIARGTAEVASLDLPAAKWSGLGLPAGSTGFRYRDTTPGGGPCKSAILKPGLLRISCKGAAIPFTLDEATQGTLSVTFAPGNGVRTCMEFGGVLKDTPALPGGPAGLFKAKAAPAPAGCIPEILP